MTSTTLGNKCSILADLWLNERSNDDFKDFIKYNDMGLPLAYALAEGIVTGTDSSNQFVEETFALLLGTMDIEDTGFQSLDELFERSEAQDAETVGLEPDAPVFQQIVFRPETHDTEKDG